MSCHSDLLELVFQFAFYRGEWLASGLRNQCCDESPCATHTGQHNGVSQRDLRRRKGARAPRRTKGASACFITDPQWMG